MVLRRRLATFAAVIAAPAVGAPLALAATTAVPTTDPVVSGPSCPDGYAGPTNLATGCPYWTMSYSVQYPGQAAVRCPVDWSSPAAGPVAGCGGVSAARQAWLSATPR